MLKLKADFERFQEEDSKLRHNKFKMLLDALKFHNQGAEAEELETAKRIAEAHSKRSQVNLNYRYFLDKDDMSDNGSYVPEEIKNRILRQSSLTSSYSWGKKSLNPKQMEYARRIMDLKKYVQAMYCANVVFPTSIGFEDKKITWKQIAEIFSHPNEEVQEAFLDKINCTHLLKQNRQEENLLLKYGMK